MTIATLVGDNGILTRANNASKAQIEGQVDEEVKLAVQSAKMYAEEMATRTEDGWLAEDQLEAVVGEMTLFDLTKEKGYTVTKDDDAGTITVTYETAEYKKATNDANAKIVIIITVINNTFTIGEVEDPSDPVTPPTTFDPSTLTIGVEEATNTDKYGNVVTGYTVQAGEMTTSVWRLFYQDSSYTYLITDELLGSYKPSDYYTGKYSNGADVSTVGQKLNPKISSLFTESNINKTILSTAWLTDPEEWDDFANTDAVFAIGAPTVELFAASYNNRSNKTTNQINPQSGTYGYTNNTSSGWLSKDVNGGIYNKDGSTNWWLASPSNGSSGSGLHVYGSNGSFYGSNVSSYSIAVRPIVCIPTSVFNSKYLSTVQ